MKLAEKLLEFWEAADKLERYGSLGCLKKMRILTELSEENDKRGWHHKIPSIRD